MQAAGLRHVATPCGPVYVEQALPDRWLAASQVRAASCDFYDEDGSLLTQESVWVENAPGEAGLIQWAGGPQVSPEGRRSGVCWFENPFQLWILNVSAKL